MKKVIAVYPDSKAFFDGKNYDIAIGRNGIKLDKKEGDGATPQGCFLIRRILFRSDRIQLPKTDFKTEEISHDDGWCDDPDDKNYNKQVKLPYLKSAESLWREDNIYDIIVVLGYNDDPVEKTRGSAIFAHLARTGFSPTAGCVAFKKRDLLEILIKADKNTKFCIFNKNKTGA